METRVSQTIYSSLYCGQSQIMTDLPEDLSMIDFLDLFIDKPFLAL